MMATESIPMPGDPGDSVSSLSLAIRTVTLGKPSIIDAEREPRGNAEDPGQPLSIFDFPRELIEPIQYLLTYHDLKALRATCKAARDAILLDDVKNAHLRLKATLLLKEAVDYTQRQQKIAEFSRWARRWPNEYRTYWSSDTISNIHKNYITRAIRLNCYMCLYNLPKECFTDRQATGARSLGHKEANMRFCTNCGVKRSIWPPGTVLKIVHKSYVICKGCCSIQKGEPYYRSLGVCSKKCQEMIENAQHLAVETQPTSAPSTDEVSGQAVREELKSIVKPSGNASTGTRATRCLRCWGIDHTDKAADGGLGMHLCKDCEVVRSGVAHVSPRS